MLHTLNKAWARIIVNQLQKGMIENALFVAKNSDEVLEIVKFTDSLIGNDGDVYHHPPYDIFLEDVVKRDMETDVVGASRLSMYDDILISHDIHDCNVKSFLSQHCRRKGA